MLLLTWRRTLHQLHRGKQRQSLVRRRVLGGIAGTCLVLRFNVPHDPAYFLILSPIILHVSKASQVHQLPQRC